MALDVLFHSLVRRPRRRQPGQLLDLTIRCHHSEFRLLPNAERRDILGFWLAKALKKFEGVGLLAVCQMSNHLHLVILDQLGQASDFMQYFLGHAAKRINKLDRVRGAVFERRFAEIPILDDDALVQRIAYAVNNPVEANLVRTRREWVGLCLFAGPVSTPHGFTVFHEARYRRALADAARTSADVDRGDFFETAQLELEALDEDLAAVVAAAVASREAELRAAQPGVLGMRRVLDTSPFDRPSMSSRTKMPLCFGSTRDIRNAFVSGWVEFVEAFRRASKAFRGGVLTAAFPAFSFRPSSAIG